MSTATPASEASELLMELTDLVQDTLALAEWEGLRGAWSLPRSPPGKAPELTPPAQAASTGPAPRAVALPAPKAPVRQPQPPPAAPAPAASAPAAPAPAAPVSSAWGKLAQERVLSGSALQLALKEAVSLPEPAERLARVREVLGDCLRCGLCRERTQVVYGVGDPAGRLVVIGEGPGEQEDLRGEPFVGKAGEMLDGMLERVLGLKRPQVYILNMVKCRPPGNRNPTEEELAACRPFLRAQLASIRPDLVLVLGSVASKALFQRPISQVRGQWQELLWPGGSSRALPTFHPAYLLRKPEDKRLTFEDLKTLRQALDAP